MIFVALALLDSPLLPRTFGVLALTLGGAFAIIGFVGLFNSVAAGAVIVLLVGEELWIAAAAIALVVRTVRAGRTGDGAVQPVPIP